MPQLFSPHSPSPIFFAISLWLSILFSALFSSKIHSIFWKLSGEVRLMSERDPVRERARERATQLDTAQLRGCSLLLQASCYFHILPLLSKCLSLALARSPSRISLSLPLSTPLSQPSFPAPTCKNRWRTILGDVLFFLTYYSFFRRYRGGEAKVERCTMGVIWLPLGPVYIRYIGDLMTKENT